jgi:hypothetical protein
MNPHDLFHVFAIDQFVDSAFFIVHFPGIIVSCYRRFSIKLLSSLCA